MMSLRAWLASRLVDHAAMVMPVPREQWGQAMQSEVAHLAPRDQLAFALGCVRGSYRMRLVDPATLLTAGRWAIVIGLGGATAVCLRTSYSLRAEDPSALIFVLGLISLAAMAAFFRGGFGRLPTIAAAGLAAALLATLAVGDPDALTGGGVATGRFYRAILIEQIAGWAALFGMAHVMLALQASRDARG